ncbi:hypothetical protein C2G38_2214449 [Gigaspora rosea]|uniref:Uncharacterized protein n=1 Tax=Gigaspora rosea TaxID=44941 RepID=A0A397UCU3_9GLOM|nr:hypothetical protein C2G38_2214449 [Gigaspora rosea]
MQVPLTDIPSILDLCTFDIISSGTGTLGGGYEILSQDRTNKGRLREGDIKTITLIDEHAKQLSNSIFAYTEYLGCSLRTKPLRMASSVKKTITNRTTSITPSMLAAELMNVAKILSITDTTPENQAQPTSTRFVPNLEAIQNALKYDKKLHYPNVLEYEKVCSIMDPHESEGTVISKQYGVKDTQDPKEQAVLLGIASTIMPTLLTKYPDFLAVDSTGRRNDTSRQPDVRISGIKNDVQLNPKWLAMDKWDPYLTAARKHFPNTQVVLCDWHEEVDQDTWIVSRFVTDIDIQHIATESDNDDSDSKNSEEPDLFDEHHMKQQEKILHVTRRSRIFACLCSFNAIREHDCQDIVAVRFFIGELKLKNSSNNKSKLERPVVESVASSSLESYLCQKDDNGHNKDELNLPQKRGSKNKRKNRLVPGEKVHLRDAILDEPYYKVQIVEVIGEGKVIVDVTFESGNTNQCMVQLADIIGYADEQVKKKTKQIDSNLI